MQHLQKPSGSHFDRAYMEYQVNIHEQAVSLVEKTSSGTDIPNSTAVKPGRTRPSGTSGEGQVYSGPGRR
jgi:hypothetical protein